jgi:hypothetical protein
MGERRLVTVRRSALLVLFLAVGCYTEDRRLAGNAIAYGNMRSFMPALQCHADAHGGYPASIEDLATATSKCPAVDVRMVRDGPEGAGLRFAGYSYHYTATSPKADGRFGRFTLLASGPYETSECPRCRSYWLDESGVLRIGQGRTASAKDRADDGGGRP